MPKFSPACVVAWALVPNAGAGEAVVAPKPKPVGVLKVDAGALVVAWVGAGGPKPEAGVADPNGGGAVNENF